MAVCLRSMLGSRAIQLSSSLRFALHQPALPKSILLQPSKHVAVTTVARDMSGKRMFLIYPSRFTWRRFQRDLHFFVMLGVIPLTLVSLYFNLIIGPAELAEIPEGYFPEEYEYYQNAVTRLFAKYFTQNPQKGYEQMLQVMYEGADKNRINRLYEKVNALQAERMDYQGYFHRKGPDVRYREKSREFFDTLKEEHTYKPEI